MLRKFQEGGEDLKVKANRVPWSPVFARARSGAFACPENSAERKRRMKKKYIYIHKQRRREERDAARKNKRNDDGIPYTMLEVLLSELKYIWLYIFLSYGYIMKLDSLEN